MAEVFQSLWRSLLSLLRPRVWGILLAPTLVALVLWVGLAVWGLSTLFDALENQPLAVVVAGWGLAGMAEVLAMLDAWGFVWVAHLIAALGGWMLLLALVWLTASLFLAIFMMPALVRLLAASDYPDVVAQGKDSFVAGTVNSLLAAFGFVVLWLITLPLWLVPGLAIVVPLVLMAWAMRRTFAYDALTVHATAAEWTALREQHGAALFALGLILALLAHLPVIGLGVPALAALSFTHYGLEALRRHRRGAVVTIEGERV